MPYFERVSLNLSGDVVVHVTEPESQQSDQDHAIVAQIMPIATIIVFRRVMKRLLRIISLGFVGLSRLSFSGIDAALV
jgi:hypothetical protein